MNEEQKKAFETYKKFLKETNNDYLFKKVEQLEEEMEENVG